MTYSYSSNFKAFIEGLVQQKNAVGFKYESAEYYLWSFDRFCMAKFPKETILSRYLVMQWAERKQTEAIGTRKIRLAYIRELAKYMIGLGIDDAYVIPERWGGKAMRRVPHFFTKEELQAFFSACDRLKPCSNAMARQLVLPVLFRVIHCCGLRSCEVRLLRVEDVDLIVGKLTIRASKGPKDRIVMLADDVLLLCRKYHEQVSYIFPERLFFFPTNTVGFYKDLMGTFERIWKEAGLETYSGNKPHVQDFRHNFALVNVNNWVKAGENVHTKLPYLSRYMGHANLESTDYYLHFVPEFFPVFKEKTRSTFDVLIPEADYEKA
jgi:integrase/recombinase XerD